MIGRLQIEMSRDSMAVSACIYPEGETEITQEMVMQELDTRGVKAGIKKDVIRDLVQFGTYRRQVVIAQGKPAERGQDGYYEFLFDKDAKEYAPTIRKDGSVDYSPNLNMVEKGDKVAIYHPATEGKNGYTVFDAVVAPPRAKELERIKFAGIDKIDNEYYAALTGHITYALKKLDVKDYMVINGNAGYGTGMINFNGDVHILGDILSDVVIKVDGNLEVDGVIEGATVTAGKDIIVHHGIHGKERARIEAGGSITANFIEAAQVIAKANIITGHMINANAVAGIGVSADGENGTIIGGRVIADEFIRASYIGNAKGYHTDLEIRSKDAWSLEYARIVVRNEMYPGTCVDLNGQKIKDCTMKDGELHVTARGVQEFDIDTYEYRDVEANLEEQAVQEKIEQKPIVLIVDDDPVFLRTQYNYLSETYQVAVVSTPRDALTYILKKCPDLILLDYMMPVMNGGDLLAKIRKLPDKKCADVPVFFLTSVTDKNVIVQCLSLYPQGYLIKPLSKEELLKIVGDFFEKAGTISGERT